MVKIRKGLLGEMDVLHRRMERMMENVLHRHGAASGPAEWNPAADLYETSDAVVVLLEVSGVDPESLEVTLEGGVLRVQGRRCGPPPRRDCVALHQMEIESAPSTACSTYRPTWMATGRKPGWTMVFWR